MSAEARTARPVTAEQAIEKEALSADRFPPAYKARMIAAYPVISAMSADEAYFADHDEREAAFMRILSSRNLRTTHELFLADQDGCWIGETVHQPDAICAACGYGECRVKSEPETMPGRLSMEERHSLRQAVQQGVRWDDSGARELDMGPIWSVVESVIATHLDSEWCAGFDCAARAHVTSSPACTTNEGRP